MEASGQGQSGEETLEEGGRIQSLPEPLSGPGRPFLPLGALHPGGPSPRTSENLVAALFLGHQCC